MADTSKPSRRDFTKGSLMAGMGALLGSHPSPAVAGMIRASSAVRLKVGCAAYSFRTYLDLKKPKMTLEEFITHCAEWGADGVELTEYYFPKPVTQAYLLRVKRLAVASGLAITGTPIGNRFTLPPGEARESQITSVRRWIDVAADLGAPTVRIFAGGAPQGTDPSQARKWAVECIESCLDQAAKRGVILVLENDGGVTSDAEGTLEIVRAVRSEWFGMNLDTGNFQTADPYSDIERCAPHAVTCHFKTAIIRKGEKKGEPADLPRMIEILRKANYRGYLNLEYEGEEDSMTAVPRYLEVIRKLVG
jgi:sugar phosphate isomerase/epimerase